MTDVLPLRIFLASPGDLQDVRLLVASIVGEFNASAGQDAGVRFELVGWEQVRGTARRGQEAINELISESHFLIALFRTRWGSEPGSPWGYTSGTEEELFTALLELGLGERPMRDIWVGFINGTERDARIDELRSKMAETHSMLYETVPASNQLKDILLRRLDGWASTQSTKVPRQVNLVPSSGIDVLQAANFRLRGEKLIDLGQADAGIKSLQAGAAIGGPLEHLSYARHLARNGDYESAYTETQRAIDFFLDDQQQLYTPLAAEAFAAQAGVLRRQGRAQEAIGRLQHAVTLAVEQNSDAADVRCRIWDNLGLAQKSVGNVAAAREAYENALESRRSYGLTVEAAHSLVNLARLEVDNNDLETALTLANQAQDALAGAAPTGLVANANVALAQILLRLGKADAAIPYATQAQLINSQLSNKQGEAIAFYVRAQCYRSLRDADAARASAQASHDLNRAMENEEGAKKAQWILDNPVAEVRSED